MEDVDGGGGESLPEALLVKSRRAMAKGWRWMMESGEREERGEED